jgi:hypothetical protein
MAIVETKVAEPVTSPAYLEVAAQQVCADDGWSAIGTAALAGAVAAEDAGAGGQAPRGGHSMRRSGGAQGAKRRVAGAGGTSCAKSGDREAGASWQLATVVALLLESRGPLRRPSRGRLHRLAARVQKMHLPPRLE